MDAGSVVHEGFHGTTIQDHSFLICPPFELELLEETAQSIVMRNGAGIREKVLKGSAFNMPMWLEHPVKDRATWNELRKRLDPDTPDRYPSDWQRFVLEMNALECPVAMEVGGFFGYLNMWVGTSNLMYMFYDDPGLVDDMMETILHLETAMVKRVMKDIRIDVAWYWEDMAYKTGPMIGPDMVKEHMVPRYRRLNEVISAGGCHCIYVDCDGNIEQLIPIWLDTGINFVWPLECAAGMDPVALRKEYGTRIILGGGLDKREFLGDKASVKREVMKKVPFLVESGAYFPSPDHLVPIDMPFENFTYYIDLLRQIRGDPPLDS